MTRTVFYYCAALVFCAATLDAFFLQHNAKGFNWLKERDATRSILHDTKYAIEDSALQSALRSDRNGPVKFDISLAVILAGYSFEAYNEPSSLGKLAYGLDGTNITFTSSEFVQRVFSGALVVTLRQGSFKGKEEGFLEKMMTGGNPDPYVIISVLEDEETSAIKTALSNLAKFKNLMSGFNGMSVEGDLKKQILSRVLDSAKSDQKDNCATATWDQSFYLYVKDPQTATLSFRAMDKDLFKEDDMMGMGAISVKELQEVSADGEMMDGVPVPLYLDMEKEKEEKKGSEKKGWLGLLNFDNQGKRRKMTRTGTLKVDVQFIPWSTGINKDLQEGVANILEGLYQKSDGPLLDFSFDPKGLNQELAKDLEQQFRRLPKGASPGVLDWAELTSTLKANNYASSPKLAATAMVGSAAISLIESLRNTFDNDENREGVSVITSTDSDTENFDDSQGMILLHYYLLVIYFSSLF
jgi:hypothetical protein